MKKGAGRRAVENGLHRHPAKNAGRERARRQERGGRSLRSARGQVVSRGRASREGLRGRADFQDRAGRAEARIAVVRGLAENGPGGGKSQTANL